jgi:hypothetical protein
MTDGGKATLSRKIDVRLRTMRDHLEGLADYAERFVAEVNRPSNVEYWALEAEWRDALDRFNWLHAQYESGSLSPDQAQQHRLNLVLLKKNLPILVKLGLALPTGALAAALASPEVVSALAELI